VLKLPKLGIEHLAGGVEIAAALIIGLAAIEAAREALPIFLRRWQALEFALAADILRTAVAPAWHRPACGDRRASHWAELFAGEGDCAGGRENAHLCSPGQFRLASSMCFGMASDQVFFTPLL